MSITSDKILQLLTTKINAGTLEALRRYETDLTASQRCLVDDLQALPGRPRPVRYVHPGVNALHTDEHDLDQAAVAWLQRLPADAEQVTFADARRLASLAAAITGTPGGSRRRLVDSIWEPVRLTHDLRQAEHDLTQAQQATPPEIPPSAHGALADAIATENDQLTAVEARQRASELLDQLDDDTRAAHADRLAQAEQRVAEVNATITDHSRLVVTA